MASVPPTRSRASIEQLPEVVTPKLFMPTATCDMTTSFPAAGTSTSNESASAQAVVPNTTPPSLVKTRGRRASISLSV